MFYTFSDALEFQGPTSTCRNLTHYACKNVCFAHILLLVTINTTTISTRKCLFLPLCANLPPSPLSRFFGICRGRIERGWWLYKGGKGREEISKVLISSKNLEWQTETHTLQLRVGQKIEKSWNHFLHGCFSLRDIWWAILQIFSLIGVRFDHAKIR